MKHLFWIMAILALCGCATPDRAWISASRFNVKSFAGRKVVVMPLLLKGPAEYANLPESQINQIQRALTRQLSVLQLSSTGVDPSEEALAVSFPYTPSRLADYGRKVNADAVVGMTILRITNRTFRRTWTMSASITFVDARDAARTWTVAKTWDFVGSPGSASAAVQLSAAFQRDFLEVRRALRIQNDLSTLNLDTVDASLDASNLAVQAVSAPSAGSPTADTTYVDIFAIDDRGIYSLELMNKATGESKLVYGSQPVIKRAYWIFQQQAVIPESSQQVAGGSSGGLPIYLADRVPLRLVNGVNEIVATAANKDGQLSRQALRVRAEVTQDRPIELMVIAADTFASEKEPRLNLSAPAQARLAQIEQQGWSSTDGTKRSFAYIGADANRSKVLRGVTQDWARGDDGTRRVLAFVGRTEMVDGRGYLMLHDTELDYPDLDSISMREFLELTNLGIDRVSFDLCTTRSSKDEVRKEIDSYVSTGNVGSSSNATQQFAPRQVVSRERVRIDVEVTEGCSNVIGAQFLKLADDEIGKQAALP